MFLKDFQNLPLIISVLLSILISAPIVIGADSIVELTDTLRFSQVLLNLKFCMALYAEAPFGLAQRCFFFKISVIGQLGHSLKMYGI